ncbi:MAG: MBOAT family protein [Cyanothece sp. SIO2G6]|nr:MBOAT family protein [Cyanothece sp. SIO2G6]
MSLLSITYGIFLLSILGIYWTREERSLRLGILLIASIVFYLSQQLQYLPLLLAITLATFYMGLAIGAPLDWRIPDEKWQAAQEAWNQRRSRLLWVGIILNILLLLGFKYLPFLLSSVGVIAQAPALQTSADWIDEQVIAPLGLSYFMFECMAYLIDVYRGAPATPNLLQFSSFKLFFPKILSGPIVRFHQVEQQFQTLIAPRMDQVLDGLWLIAWGAMKKLLLADHIATFVNLSFDNIERAGSGDLWLATFAYGLQLYLDFSGYVDVARGSATLLGFELPRNFDAPYFASSIADFWRRWHMTLGDWLRNYLYFPLGGSRKSLARTCLNLVIVMAIAGIWHDAGWGFIIWGLIHGVALALHRLTDAQSNAMPKLQDFWRSPLGVVLSWLITQFTVFGAWLFFRLPNPQDFGLALQRLFGHVADIQFGQKIYLETLGLDRFHLALWLLGLFGLMGATYGIQRSLKLQLNWHFKVCLVPVFLFLAWLLAPENSLPYIYFDF